MSEHLLSKDRSPEDRDECVSKFILASDLEMSGKIDEAISCYREVLEIECDENYQKIARASLERLEQSVFDESEIETSLENSKTKLPLQQLLGGFYNLPIATKLLLVMTLEAISIFGLVSVGTFALRSPSSQQATQESSIAQRSDNHPKTPENRADRKKSRDFLNLPSDSLEPATLVFKAPVDRTTDVSQNPLAVSARGVSEQFLEELTLDALGVQAAILVCALSIGVLLALFLGKCIVIPVKELKQTAESISAGKRSVKAEVMSDDEIGQLSNAFNQMTDSLIAVEAEIKKERKEKESLQEKIGMLLLEIEAIQKGSLTAKGDVGGNGAERVSDSANATIDKSIGKALNNVSQINELIREVSSSTVEAATIARRALDKTQEADVTMDETVNSIENIRVAVADTAKKLRQLAESSQEISQIVSIISGISEKTNLLAFNASVEAARAREQGEGFRMIADEVRRLEDRVTEATKDIQHLVKTIQKETASVLETIETSTAEVINGTKLVRKTKKILQDLAATNQNIDGYLQTISSSAEAQTQASQEANRNLEKVAIIAKENSTKARDLLRNLRSLVKK